MNLDYTRFRRTMIKRILSLVFAIAVVQAPTTAKEVNSYWIEYGNEPVLILSSKTITAPCKRLNLLAFKTGC